MEMKEGLEEGNEGEETAKCLQLFAVWAAWSRLQKLEAVAFRNLPSAAPGEFRMRSNSVPHLNMKAVKRLHHLDSDDQLDFLQDESVRTGL